VKNYKWQNFDPEVLPSWYLVNFCFDYSEMDSDIRKLKNEIQED